MSQSAFWRGILFAAAILAAAPAARADWAVLRNGQRLHVTGYERRGSEVILQLAGGEATLPASAVLRFEPEDIFPAAKPAPAQGPYGEIVAKAQVTSRVGPGLVFATFHFPESAANFLTNPAMDPNANKSAENLGTIAKLIGAFA